MKDNYNEKIANQLLANELKMIKKHPQHQLFNNYINSIENLQEKELLHGGNRSLKYVNAGNNSETFSPSTLVVGGQLRKRGRPSKKLHGGDIWSDIGNVAKTVAPIAIPLMLSAAGLPKKQRKPRKPQGGSFFGDIGNVAKSIGSSVAKDVILPVAVDTGKDMLKSYMTSKSTGSGLKKRGRPRKNIEKGGDFFSSLRDIGKEITPIAKDIAVPIATQALTSYMKGQGLKKPTKRNLMIKEMMRKNPGLTLGEASKYIKQNNLA